MSSYLNYGDAIIYEKITTGSDYNHLKIGDIIVFKSTNNLIIHRIYDIKYDEELTITTKGDANDNIDPYLLTKDDIVGIYLFKIKYLGIPTLWLKDVLK